MARSIRLRLVVRIIERDKAKAKSDPEGIHIILDSLKLNREEALFVGDDPVLDVIAGRNTNVRTALFANDPFFPNK